MFTSQVAWIQTQHFVHEVYQNGTTSNATSELLTTQINRRRNLSTQIICYGLKEILNFLSNWTQNCSRRIRYLYEDTGGANTASFFKIQIAWFGHKLTFGNISAFRTLRL
jgi:hypothetical protein